MTSKLSWRSLCTAIFIVIAAFLWWSGPAMAMSAPQNQPVIVLVPGFFNSLVPGHVRTQPPFIFPYFSGTIVHTLQNYGTVVTVNTLMPVGTVEQNGEILGRFLAATAMQYPGRQMILVAHSAGGLYSMWALTNRPDLPVRTVLTIATPYGGVEMVDNIATQVKPLDTLALYMNLESLRQFKKSKVAALLAGFRLPENVRWIALAGSQPPCSLLACGDSRNLSWILTLAQMLMKNSSDGIVTVDSALARNIGVRGSSGGPFRFEAWHDLNFALEHWEMVEDSRLFKVLGIVNTGHIHDMQRRLFEQIFDRLGQPRL